MDLSIYLVTAVIVTFAVGAAVGLWLSIVGGHWKPSRRSRPRGTG